MIYAKDQSKRNAGRANERHHQQHNHNHNHNNNKNNHNNQQPTKTTVALLSLRLSLFLPLQRLLLAYNYNSNRTIDIFARHIWQNYLSIFKVFKVFRSHSWPWGLLRVAMSWRFGNPEANGNALLKSSGSRTEAAEVRGDCQEVASNMPFPRKITAATHEVVSGTWLILVNCWKGNLWGGLLVAYWYAMTDF